MSSPSPIFRGTTGSKPSSLSASTLREPLGQTATQCPQSTQRSARSCAADALFPCSLSVTTGILRGHTFAHIPHPLHVSESTWITPRLLSVTRYSYDPSSLPSATNCLNCSRLTESGTEWSELSM